MKVVVAEPARLRDQHDQPDLVERIAGQAARDSAEPEELGAVAMARIAGRIDLRRCKAHRPPPLHWVLVVGAFLLGIVTAASAAYLDLLPRWLAGIVPRQTTSAPTKRRALAGGNGEPTENAPSATVEMPEAPSVEELVVKPTPAPAAAEATTSALKAAAARHGEALAENHRVTDGGPRVAMPVDRKVVPSASPTAGPAESAAAGGSAAALPESTTPFPRPSAGTTEGHGFLASLRKTKPDATRGSAPSAEAPSGSPQVTASASPAARASIPASEAVPSSSPQTAGLLKEIVRALRVEHAPNRALALLDRHSGELAGQAFAEEALLLRVEAMLALGERAAVLRLLDRTSLADLAVSSTLLITRGELRAAANRCAEGIGDFDLALADSRRPPKPALLGRARCKQRLGDLTGARADFDRYRREFPDDPLR